MFWSLFAEMLLELEEHWSVKIASSQYRESIGHCLSDQASCENII